MGSGSLSKLFWGLDLGEGLPKVLSEDGVSAERGERARVSAFLRREVPFLSEEQAGTPLDDRAVAVKRWYLGEASDLLELRHQGETVGVLIGAPEDWSSYYVRMFATSARYQQRRLTRRFFNQCLYEPLTKHGVERLIADTSPGNLAMAHCFTEQHFYVSGQILSERWGPLIRYTRFLAPSRREAFLSQFGRGAPPRQQGG